MNRAVVIKTMGDPEIGEAIARGMLAALGEGNRETSSVTGCAGATFPNGGRLLGDGGRPLPALRATLHGSADPVSLKTVHWTVFRALNAPEGKALERRGECE